MIKFTAELFNGGTLYGFGLSEANLNRMEFNHEPIFFDFGYAKMSNLFGLILYLDKYATPEEILDNFEEIRKLQLPFLNMPRGVTPETLIIFPMARNIMARLRKEKFWCFETNVNIKSAHDKQIFLAARTEQEIEKFFLDAGFITKHTKRSQKGFERE